MEGNRHRILPNTFDESIGNRKVSCTADTLCHTWLHIYQNNQLVKQNNKIKKKSRTCARKPTNFCRADCRRNETDWMHIRGSVTNNDDHKPVLLYNENDIFPPPISLLQSHFGLKINASFENESKMKQNKSNTSVTKVAFPLQGMATRESDTVQFNLTFAGFGRARFLAKEWTLVATI